MTLEDPEEALRAATPPGWYVGRPSFHDERNEWLLFAFDPRERAVDGIRQREWTAACVLPFRSCPSGGAILERL